MNAIQEKRLKKYLSSVSIAMDKGNHAYRQRFVYNVSCVDGNDSLLNLLKHIKKAAGSGHSFSVVVDPDTREAKSFFIDGDGADRIDDIVVTPVEYNLESVLLSALHKIRGFCNETKVDSDTGERITPCDEAVKWIHEICTTILGGIKKDFGRSDNELVEIIENNCRYCLEDGSDKTETMKHIIKICQDFRKGRLEAVLDEKRKNA